MAVDLLEQEELAPAGGGSGPPAAERAPARRRIPHLLHTLLPGMLIAAVLTFALEFAHALERPWREALAHVLELDLYLWAIGWLVIWALILLLQALTNRLWLAAGVVTALVVAIAFADLQKVHFRGEPLYPTDVVYLAQPELLTDTTGMLPALGLLLGMALIPAIFWAVARTRPQARMGLVGRGLGVVVGSLVLFTAGTFNQPDNALRNLYEAGGTAWAPWSQRQNYSDNGMVAGMLYNVPTSAMDEPSGYTAEAMADLVVRYTQRAAELNEGRDPAALADTNIILILSESLSDPLRLTSITAAEDPLPYTRKMMETNPSGTLLSPGYGGGTSSVEFEVLTGMSGANLQPQVNSPLQSLVAARTDFPSQLDSFGTPERETLALHPYAATFYRRNVAYPALGFERAVFRDKLGHLEKLPGDNYVSDAALFGQLVDELARTDKPMLVNVVTMQNHGPQQPLADPIPVEGPLTDGQQATAGQYLRGLAHSDLALQQLVADLAALGERSIMLLYGDHLPTVWPEGVLAASGPTARYETPWLIFATFETEPIAVAPVLGANQLFNQVLDAAGAPHTPWTALLHDLGTEVPAMEGSGWFGPDGAATAEDELTAKGQQLLADYRLAQYDMVAGENWATQELLAAGD